MFQMFQMMMVIYLLVSFRRISTTCVGYSDSWRGDCQVVDCRPGRHLCYDDDDIDDDVDDDVDDDHDDDHGDDDDIDFDDDHGSNFWR